MARNIVGLTRKCLHPKSLPRIHKAYISGPSPQEMHSAGIRFWPAYLQPNEQRILLRASLHKLDNSESIKSRKKRRAYLKALPPDASESDNVQSCFLPDDYYEFQEV
jgi:alkylated DNA repair protein alkB family protein 7